MVVFSDSNARVIYGIAKDALVGAKNIVTNPDLSAVKGLPPHYWKLSDGKVVSMSDDEKRARDLLHASISPAASDAHKILAQAQKQNFYFRIIELVLVAGAVALVVALRFI